MLRHGKLIGALQEIEKLEGSGVLETENVNQNLSIRWRILKRIRSRKHYYGENISTSPKLRTLILKSTVLEELGNSQGAHETSLQAIEEANNDKGHLSSQMDAFQNRASVLCNTGQNDESLKIIIQGLRLFEPLSSDQQEHHISQKGYFLYLKGKNLRMKGELDEGLKFLEQGLSIFNKLGNELMIAESCTIIGIIRFYQGLLDDALDLFEKSIDIFQKLEYKKQIASNYNNMANVYHSKGDLDNSLEFHGKSLVIKEEINHKVGIAISVNNIGEVYIQKHELDQALDYLQKGLALFIELGNNFYASHTLDSLIALTIELSMLDKAREYLDVLTKIDEKESSPNIHQKRRVSEAIVLKTSSRSRNRGKAEELLNEVINEDIADHSTTIKAMIHLCDLLLDELKATGDKEVLKEIQNLTERLQSEARQQQSFSLLTQTYLIKAKLAMLTLDISKSRQLLTQAELQAEEHGLHQLAMKISLEHDSLLEKEQEWEEAKQRKATIAELIELSQVDASLSEMTRIKQDELQTIENEKPVMLFILAKTGLSLHSRTFEITEGLSNVDEQLFAGFLSAINTFGDQFFSSTLDRARVGGFTLVLKSLAENLLVCYVFTGATYHAVQKMIKFVEKVKNDSRIGQMLSTAHDKYGVLDPSDEDYFNGVISDTFLTV